MRLTGIPIYIFLRLVTRDSLPVRRPLRGVGNFQEGGVVGGWLIRIVISVVGVGGMGLCWSGLRSVQCHAYIEVLIH
jgi:hypothetical protein